MQKLSFIFSLFATLVLAACGCDGAKTGDAAAADNTAQAPVAAPAASSENCYILAEGKDTTWLTLKIDGETVTGKYHWHPHEKDGGHGTIAGKIQGGIADVMYDYTIEGSNQKEQMMFKIEGDKVVQIIGELEDKDGILRIKDASKPVRTDAFVKGACNTVD